MEENIENIQIDDGNNEENGSGFDSISGSNRNIPLNEGFYNEANDEDEFDEDDDEEEDDNVGYGPQPQRCVSTLQRPRMRQWKKNEV
ncbi:hypothetical protein U1Q18_050766 [Sarracenia purpurea var. burkii]